LTRQVKARGLIRARFFASQNWLKPWRTGWSRESGSSAGQSRKEAIYAAYDRFYKGDIARELVRGCQEEGALITMEDLAGWKVYVEEQSWHLQGNWGL
jgi:hypothetical protein